VFKEDEFAAWPQNASHTSDGLHDSRNRAQRKGANDRVNRAVIQGKMFPRKVQEFDIQLCSAPLLFCKSKHPRVWFERIHLVYPRGIVVGEVYAGAHADFEDFPLSQRDDPLANFPDGLRIAQYPYQMGVDMISVEAHMLSLLPLRPAARGSSYRWG
jgi:hypothetical protein